MAERSGIDIETFEELNVDSIALVDNTGAKGGGESSGGSASSPKAPSRVSSSGRTRTSSGAKETDSDDPTATARSNSLNQSESSSSGGRNTPQDRGKGWQFIGTPKSRGSTKWFSFIMSHHEKNAEIHKIFSSLTVEEKLIDDYSCALQRDILIHGRMYVTQKCLCFYANIFSWETILTIPFETVTSITKERTALLIPNAILITTTAEKYGFSSFIQRDVSYNIIFKVWQNSLSLKPLPPIGLVRVARKAWGDSTEVGTAEELWGEDGVQPKLTRLPPRQISMPTHLEIGQVPVSADIDTTAHGASVDANTVAGRERAILAVAPTMSVPATLPSNSTNALVGFTVPPATTSNNPSADSTPASRRHFSYHSSTSHLTGETDSIETTAQLNTLPAEQLAGDSSPAHASVASQPTPEQSPQRQTQELKSVGGDSNGSSDQFETCSFDEIGEVSCKCPEHIGRTIINDVYNTDVETLFQLLFTDSDFLRSFLATRKTTNIVMGEWVPQPDSTRLRDLTYTLALNYSFGPKFSPSSEHQVYLKNGQPGVQHIVKTEVVNGNIPYGDTFFVSCCFCMTRVSHDKARLRITSNICFKKNCWGLVKNLIERNAGDGIRSYYNQLDTSLKEFLLSHPSRGLHSSVRRPHRRIRHRRQLSNSKTPQPPPLQEEENEGQQPIKKQRRGSSSSRLSLKSLDHQVHATEDDQRTENKQELSGSQSLPKVNLVLTVLLGMLILFNMALYRQLTGFQSLSPQPSTPFTPAPSNHLPLQPNELGECLNKQSSAACQESQRARQKWSDKPQDSEHKKDDDERQRWLQSMQRVVEALKEIESTVSVVRKELELILTQSRARVPQQQDQAG